MEFKQIQENNEYTAEPYAKRMKRIDLEEMKLLQRNISTPASPVEWREIKELYKDFK